MEQRDLNKKIASEGLQALAGDNSMQELYLEIIKFFKQLKDDETTDEFKDHYKKFIGLYIIVISHYPSIINYLQENQSTLKLEDFSQFIDFHLYLTKVSKANFPEVTENLAEIVIPPIIY